MGNNDDNFELTFEATIAETDDDLCRSLWLSVILQMIIDARSESRKPSNIRRRDEALDWLDAEDEEDSDFAMICDLAGIDFETMRRKAWRIVRGKSEQLDFRCLRKPQIQNRAGESRSAFLGRTRRRHRQKLARAAKLAQEAMGRESEETCH